MTYTWLLIDADDTLFDYSLAENKALRSTFEQFGQAYCSQYLQIYQVFNRQVWEGYERGEISTSELRLTRFRLLFDKTSISIDPQDFSQHYLENLSHASDLFPSTTDVLKELSGRYHMALVTNGLKDVQRPRLEHSAIRSFIEKTFISEEMGVAKPAVGFFEAVFREIGFPAKSDVLIIGDSLTSDMQGGINYGIDTCWFNLAGKTSSLPVTYMIIKFGQLLEILN
ncbi:MAG: YjjG family noncanonical pyrimidine nucleotidase [Anaerolineales bacterium]|jgi:YjjG family noncanonical pyrimidine nucleotidase